MQDDRPAYLGLMAAFTPAGLMMASVAPVVAKQDAQDAFHGLFFTNGAFTNPEMIWSFRRQAKWVWPFSRFSMIGFMRFPRCGPMTFLILDSSRFLLVLFMFQLRAVRASKLGELDDMALVAESAIGRERDVLAPRAERPGVVDVEQPPQDHLHFPRAALATLASLLHGLVKITVLLL